MVHLQIHATVEAARQRLGSILTSVPDTTWQEYYERSFQTAWRGLFRRAETSSSGATYYMVMGFYVFRRDCYIGFAQSTVFIEGDQEFAGAVDRVRYRADYLDERLQNPGAYGLPSCGTSPEGTTTSSAGSNTSSSPVGAGGDPCADMFSAFGGGALTRQEVCDILDRTWPPPRSDDWSIEFAEALGRATDLRLRLLMAGRQQTGGSLSAEQEAILTSLDQAVTLGSFTPSGSTTSAFPALKGLSPVLAKMAAAAVGPPYDASAATAFYRLMRMGIGITLEGVSPNPPVIVEPPG